MTEKVLSLEQIEAYDGLTAFINKGEPGYRVVWGLAGTGKTEILGMLWEMHPMMIMTATTGKAASNLRKRFEGCDCRTLHSTILKYDQESCSECQGLGYVRETRFVCDRCGGRGECKVCHGTGERKTRDKCKVCDGDGKKPGSKPNLTVKSLEEIFGVEVADIEDTHYFSERHQEWRPRDVPRKPKKVLRPEWPRVIAVDEASMLGTELYEHMQKLDCMWIIVGDPGQLPPVNDVAVFTDPSYKPDYELIKIQRQGEGSAIIKQAHSIRNGMGYRNEGDEFRVIQWPDTNLIYDQEVAIRWRNLHVRNANRHRREALKFDPEIMERGEPLVCLHNLYDYDLYNGTACSYWDHHVEQDEHGRNIIYLDVERDDGVVVSISGAEIADFSSLPVSQCTFRLAYSITCHKAQGSEYESVYIQDSTHSRTWYNKIEGTKEDQEEYARKWLYTAVTRARKRVVIFRNDSD